MNILLRAFPDPEQDRVHHMLTMSIDRNSFDFFSKILDAQREFVLTPDLIGRVACRKEFLLYCLMHTKISDEQIKNLLLISLDTPRIYRDDAIIASGPTTEAVRQIALTRKVAAERSCCCFRWF